MQKINWIILASKDRGINYGVGTFIKQLSKALKKHENINVFIIETGITRSKLFSIRIQEGITILEIPVPENKTRINTRKKQEKLSRNLISVFALPYPVFSIYYQAVKAKKWCPFCLVVQVILIAEFILLFPVIKTVSISITQLLGITVSFLVPTSVWLLFISHFSNLQKYRKVKYSYLAFKRNPEIFRFILDKGEYLEIIPAKYSLILGDQNAKVRITAFLSLYCNPCKNAFKQLKRLLDNCTGVNINAIFSVYDDEQSKKLINIIYYIYQTKGQLQTVDFLSNWYNSSMTGRKKFYEKDIPTGFDISKQIKKENQEIYEENQVSGTPAIFVNGYKMPGQYELIDIEYFIDEIKDLTRESVFANSGKWQEADANKKPLPASHIPQQRKEVM